MKKKEKDFDIYKFEKNKEHISDKLSLNKIYHNDNDLNISILPSLFCLLVESEEISIR